MSHHSPNDIDGDDLPRLSSMTNTKVLESRFVQIKQELSSDLSLQTHQPEVGLKPLSTNKTNMEDLERRFCEIKKKFLELELETPQPEVGSKGHSPTGEPQPGMSNPSKKVRVDPELKRRNDTTDKISALTNQLQKLSQLIENFIQAKLAEDINMKRLMVEIKFEMDYFKFLYGSHSSGSDDVQGNVSTVNENAAVGVDLEFDPDSSNAGI